MFLLDNLLLSPVNGIMAIFREIQKAAQQEIETEAETVRTQLCDLYQLLETKQITAAEFDDREHKLLDRLDAIEARQSAAKEEDEDAEEDEEFEEEDEDEEHETDAEDTEDAEVVELETEEVAVGNAG